MSHSQSSVVLTEHEESKPIHFVGIGGIGMSAIAEVLLEEGYTISGSDLRLSPITDNLARKGAKIFQGHAAENIGEAGLVVISSAVPLDNAEVLEAKRRGLPVIKRAEMLGRLMADRFGIAIAGTHGKTTTSSLIALILEQAGLEPTILVGGEMLDLGTNAKLGKGRYLVAEADEFDGSFLQLKPQMAVVTNIEPDHLDTYGSFEALIDAFHQFMASVPEQGYIVACSDDARIRGVLETNLKAKTISGYGISTQAEWQAVALKPNAQGGTDFTVERKGERIGRFSIRLPGEHNVANALAAIAASFLLGIEETKVRQTLASFRGARRRFEIKGEVGGITVVDDYAHHPTEIIATLKAARTRFGKRRIICVFQPHTYSRTKFLFKEFTTAFGDADEVVITDIYAAREKDTLGISAADLATAICHPIVRYIGDLTEAAESEGERLQPGDVLMTVGAGDVDKVSDLVLKGLAQR